MTSHTGQPIITRQIISNISKSKGNQSMKFSQVIEHNVRNVFLLKNDPERLDPDLFQFYEPFTGLSCHMATKWKSVVIFLFCKIIPIPYCVSKRVDLDSSSKYEKDKNKYLRKGS